MTEPDINAILTSGKADLQKAPGPDAEAKIRQDTAKNYPAYARLSERLIKNFVQFLKVY